MKKIARYILAAFMPVLIFALTGCSTEQPQANLNTHTRIEFGPYTWLVLDEQSDKKLLITEDIISQRYYHNYSEYYITWEISDIRYYLNNDFLEQFTFEERERIAKTRVANSDSLWFSDYSTGGNDTTDMVFLLSVEEADKYFGNSEDYLNRRGWQLDENFQPPRWARRDGGIKLSNRHDDSRIALYNGEPLSWWLRSPGGFNFRAATVATDGAINMLGINVNERPAEHFGVGVRPALWLHD